MPVSLHLPLPHDLLVTALVLHDPATAVLDADLAVSSRAGRLAPLAHEALARQIGDLRLLPVPDLAAAPVPPEGLLAVHGADDSTLARMRSAVRGTAIGLVCSAAEALSANRAVRAAAVLLTGPRDVLIDTEIPRIWLAEGRGDVSTVDWFLLDRSAARSGRADTRTHGLNRFGLPELMVREVADADLPAWDAVLSGVAEQLVRALPTADGAVELASPTLLRMTDVAAAYGEPVDGADPTLARSTGVEVDLVECDGGQVLVLSGEPLADLFGAG